MRDVTLRELSELIRKMPVMAQMHPMSLAFLEDTIRVFSDAWDIAAELDSPLAQPADLMLSTGFEPALHHRLPAVHCVHDPLTPELNSVLLKRYAALRSAILNQSQVANEIISHSDVEAVVLMLVDGLAYADVKDKIVSLVKAPTWQLASDGTSVRVIYDGKSVGPTEYIDLQTSAAETRSRQVRYSLEPVLVDGLSITEHGMVRLVGDPPLVHRLQDTGISSYLGFTYWERAEEPLTDRLFRGFGERVRRVKKFDDVVSYLDKSDVAGTFVQVVRMGLDGMAHRQREQPTIQAATEAILADFGRLVQLYIEKGVPARLYMVSDHGILWAHEHEFEVYELRGVGSPRYYDYAKTGDHVKHVLYEGKDFSMLEYPYVRRELKSNEWGVHGGLSYQESVVPLIAAQVTG